MRTLIFAALSFPVLISACGSGEARETGGAEGAALTSEGANLPAPPTRRVWAQPGDYASVSPREPLMAFVDWSTGDVAVHDLNTGEDRRVTDTGGWMANGSWAEFPMFSPDGQSLVYAYGNVMVESVQSGESPFRYQLRIIHVDGTQDRAIWQAQTFPEFARPMAWSSSRGIVVAVWTEEAPDGRMALVSPDDGAMQTLKPFAPGLPCPCVEEASFSPDGTFLAYREGAKVFLMNLDTGEDRDLDLEARSILAWTPDGSGFLIHANREGVSGFWHVPVENGGRAGTPSLVRGGIPAASRAGRMGDSFYYHIPVEAPRLYQASVDMETGRVLSAPTALTSISQGMAAYPAWSQDGRQLAYAIMDVDQNVGIHVRSADGEEATALVDLGKVRGVGNLTWSTSGSELYYMVYIGDQGFLYRTDTRSGATEEILANPIDEGSKPMLVTPDGTRAVVSRNFPRADHPVARGLILADLNTGAETVLSDDSPEALSLSPDGTAMAALLTDSDNGPYRRLLLYPIGGGPPRLLAQFDRGRESLQPPGGLSWSADGRYVLGTYWICGQDGNPDRYELRAFPVAGGDPVSLGPVQYNRAAPVLHPDGRRLAFVDGQLRGEVWVMKGWE